MEGVYWYMSPLFEGKSPETLSLIFLLLGGYLNLELVCHTLGCLDP